MTDAATTEVARLRRMMTWPEKAHIRDTLRRRIFAIEQDIPFGNPFNEVDEVLYRIGGRQ